MAEYKTEINKIYILLCVELLPEVHPHSLVSIIIRDIGFDSVGMLFFFLHQSWPILKYGIRDHLAQQMSK